MNLTKFKKNVANAKINIRFLGFEKFTVNFSLVKDATHYNCYLFVNDNLVEKRRYQRSNKFEFDLSTYSLNDSIKIRCYYLNNVTNQRTAKSVVLTKNRLGKFVLSPELKKLEKSDWKQLGKKLVQKQILKLGPFPEYEIKNGFDFWEDDPFKNRSWQWRVHWFEFINYLLAYFHRTQDIKALETSKESIISWLDNYQNTETSFEFIWHDHATALRAEVLLVFYCYIKEFMNYWGDSNKEFLDRLQAFLVELKDKLLEEKFYSKHTNHGLEQARVLLLLSIYFRDIKSQKIAVNRISSELDFSFTSEGVHKENSPGYHQFVLKVFLGIITRFPKNILGDLSQKFDKIGSKALGFLAHIIRPDGHLPIIGDTELIRPTDSYAKYFKDTLEYQEFLYSVTQGRRGQKPKENFKVYEKSGYAIYRNKWGERKEFDQVLQLILKAGCLSQYHHQQDEGHIVLYAFGEDWLIDSGLYNYINSDPIRRYMRSRRAHNIPVIPNTSYSSNFKDRIKSWSLHKIKSQSNFHIQTQNNVLQNVYMNRELIYEKKGYSFKVIDNIIFTDHLTRPTDFYWHIPNDKEISIIDDVAYIKSKKNNIILKITPNIAPLKTHIIKSYTDQKINSCISKKFGSLEESYCIIFSYTHKCKANFKISFDFSFCSSD